MIWQLEPFSDWEVLKDKYDNLETWGELAKKKIMESCNLCGLCGSTFGGGEEIATRWLMEETRSHRQSWKWKDKNSLSPASHFWHRQVSDPSHGHMDLVGCPSSILAKNRIFICGSKWKKAITSQNGQLQLREFAVKVMKRLTQLKTCSLSQVISKLADITNTNNL